MPNLVKQLRNTKASHFKTPLQAKDLEVERSELTKECIWEGFVQAL